MKPGAILACILGAFVGTFAFHAAGCGKVRAAWGPRGCSVEQTAAAPFTGWREQDGASLYFHDGRLVGCYRSGNWYPYGENGYAAAVTPPWKVVTAACKCGVCKCDTCKCGIEAKPKETGFKFGVDTAKLHKDGINRYSISGRPVQRHEAIAALQLTDDSAKPFVTFIGANALEAAKAFQSTPLAATARVHGYEQGHWATQCGFVSGSPMVYVQNAKGEVLYRKDNPPVAELVQELRKAQPDYNPALDPNGKAPTFDIVAALKSLPGYVWGIVGGVLALLFARRNS